MSEFQYLFPTPILVKKANTSLLLSEYDVMGDIEFSYNKKEYWGITHKLYPSGDETFGGDVIRKHNLNYLHTLVDEAVTEYCQMLDMDKTSYNRTSWFTMCDKGDYAHIHDHGKADLSGVIYYEVPEGSGNLFFTSPVAQAKVSGWFLKHHICNATQQPEVGKMVVFPGWLNHGVTSSESDKRRVSLSFNIFLQRN